MLGVIFPADTDALSRLLCVQPEPTDTSGELAAKYRVVYLPAPPREALLRSYASPQDEAIAAAFALDAVDAGASALSPVTEDTVTPSRDARQGPFSAAKPYPARLVSNRRVTADAHGQDVRLLELDLGEGSPEEDSTFGVQYVPGDVIALWPQQRQPSVDAFLQRCNLDAGAWVRIQPAQAENDQLPAAVGGGGGSGATATADEVNHRGSKPQGGGIVVRVGALVAGALDVDSAVPRRVLFEALQRFAPPGSREHERLAHFASPQGRDELHDYNKREGERGHGMGPLLLSEASEHADPPVLWNPSLH